MACLGVGWRNARRTRTTRSVERVPRKAATSSALVSMYCLPRGANSAGACGSEDDWQPSNLFSPIAANDARVRSRIELDAVGLARGNALAAAAMVLSVGRYKLGPVLRADAQCMVRLCTDKEDDDCEYTVRVLEKNNVRRRGKASAIKREVAAMTEMHHDNILRLHDVVASAARLYLVYERVHGAHLGAYISKRGPLHPTRAQQLIRSIARALDHAHKRGVYHGTLAPSRIIIPSDECFSNTKVFGFSIFVPNDITTASGNDAIALAAILALVIAAAPPPLPSSAPCGARLLYTALQHPDPTRRPTMAEVLQTPWLSTKNENTERGNAQLLPPAPPPPAFPNNVSLLKTIDVLPQRSSCEAYNPVPSTSSLSVSQKQSPSISRETLDATNAVRNCYLPSRGCMQSHSATLSPALPSRGSSDDQFTDAPNSLTSQQADSNEHKVSSGEHGCAIAPDGELIETKNESHQLSISSSATVPVQLATIDSPTKPIKCTVTEFSSPVTLPKDDPVMDDDDISPYFASSRITVGQIPNTIVSNPKASSINKNACTSSSTISSSSDGECLTQMVRSVLPKYSPRRARRVVQKLNKAGVDNTDDIRFLVSSVGSCKKAADWFERVTNLSPIVCLRVVNAVASPQS